MMVIDELARALALLKTPRERTKIRNENSPALWAEFDRELDAFVQRAEVAVDSSTRKALWTELEALARRWRFESLLERASRARDDSALEGLGLESMRGHHSPRVSGALEGFSARNVGLWREAMPSPATATPLDLEVMPRGSEVALIIAFPVMQAPDVVPVSTRFEISIRTRAKPPHEGAVGVAFSRQRTGPVTVVARVVTPLPEGLVLDGCGHAPLEIPEDQDSAAASFEMHATRADTYQIAIALEDPQGVTVTQVSRRVAAVDTMPEAPTIRASTMGASVSFSPVPSSGMVLKYVRLPPESYNVTLQSARVVASEPWVVKSTGFDQLVALCRKVKQLPGYSAAGDREAMLEDLGVELAEVFLPTSVRDALRDPAFAEGASLHIESDDAWVPWEMLRVGSGPRAFFLGERFAVTRGVLVQRLRAEGCRAPAFCIDALTGTTLTIERERDALRALTGEDPVDLRTFADARRVLRDGPPAGIVHVASHGTSSETDPFGSALVLPGGNLVSANVPSARGTDAAGLVVGALVFVNACESGVPSAGSLRREETWPQVFMAGGAAACVATSWRVDNTVAGVFAEAVYARLGQNVTLGEAVRQARGIVRAVGDANRLAWAVYGLPTFRLIPREIP